ncbi:lytic transglycosylase domain-containing protein [Aeromonas veronii]
MNKFVWLCICVLAFPLSAEPLQWVRIPAVTSLSVSKEASLFREPDIDGKSTRYKTLIAEIAGEHDLDPLLVQAVVAVESAYCHDVISDKGAVGLMQLMPATAARYGKYALTIPRENLEVGVTYLGDLLKKFGRLDLALAGYNAGEGAIYHYGNRIPPYPETQRYVARVLDYYNNLKKEGSYEYGHKVHLGYHKGQIWRILIGNAL